MASDFMDQLQDPAWPGDYPASVAFVLRKLYAGRSLLEGYLWQGAFYADEAHTTALAATKERLYVDVPSGTAFRWDGESYVTVSVSSADDAAAVHYVSEERSSEQKEVARANIGAASASDVSTLQSKVATLVGKSGSWDAKQDGIAWDDEPTEDSENAARSGGIFRWVRALVEKAKPVWSNVTGTPTTVSGYGITDAATSVRFGETGSVISAKDGLLAVPDGTVVAKGAVRYDAVQSLTAEQRRQALANLGWSSDATQTAAASVKGAWSSRMSDSEKTTLLGWLARYVVAKEGLTWDS